MQTFLSSSWKENTNSPGNCYQTSCFPLSLSIAENNGNHLGKCIFQHSRRAQIQNFLAHHGGYSGVTKYVTNSMFKKSPSMALVPPFRFSWPHLSLTEKNSFHK